MIKNVSQPSFTDSPYTHLSENRNTSTILLHFLGGMITFLLPSPNQPNYSLGSLLSPLLLLPLHILSSSNLWPLFIRLAKLHHSLLHRLRHQAQSMGPSHPQSLSRSNPSRLHYRVPSPHTQAPPI